MEQMKLDHSQMHLLLRAVGNEATIAENIWKDPDAGVKRAEREHAKEEAYRYSKLFIHMVISMGYSGICTPLCAITGDPVNVKMLAKRFGDQYIDQVRTEAWFEKQMKNVASPKNDA